MNIKAKSLFFGDFAFTFFMPIYMCQANRLKRIITYGKIYRLIIVTNELQ